MLAILVQVHKKMAIRLKILNEFDENFDNFILLVMSSKI